MHEPIRENLEDYLRGPAAKVPREFGAHLEACEECAGELRRLENQARMLRSLQAGQEQEPRAGFYARVMERIEEQSQSSIWSVLLQPRIGRRLAVASAALALLLAGYLVSTEPGDLELAAAPPAVVLTDMPAPDLAAKATTSSVPPADVAEPGNAKPNIAEQKAAARPHVAQPSLAQREIPQDVPDDTPLQQQQRDAVLVNLASFRQ